MDKDRHHRIITERRYAELYVLHAADLQKYIQIRFGKSTQEAADLSHQAFINFISAEEQTKISNPRAFLFQTAKNLVFDASRHQRVRANYQISQSAVAEETEENLSERRVLGEQKLEALRGFIRVLPAKQRRAFVLHRIHELSYEVIAKDMGVSRDAVKKLVLRALETCQRKMEQKFKD